jgi:hypothetical protein
MQEVGQVLEMQDMNASAAIRGTVCNGSGAQRGGAWRRGVSGLHERGAKHFVAVVVKSADLMKDDWRKMEGRRGGVGKEPLGQ